MDAMLIRCRTKSGTYFRWSPDSQDADLGGKELRADILRAATASPDDIGFCNMEEAISSLRLPARDVARHATYLVEVTTTGKRPLVWIIREAKGQASFYQAVDETFPSR